MPATNTTALPEINSVRRTEIVHGLTKAGDIAAMIGAEKVARLAAGAKRVEVTFGRVQGTLMVFEWMVDEPAPMKATKESRARGRRVVTALMTGK